jgi:hypothetical protein
MNHCQHCRWWSERAVTCDDSFGTCTRAHSTNGQADHPDSLAFASDTESYNATFNTRPDFGCIQFEPHPATLPIVRK